MATPRKAGRISPALVNKALNVLKDPQVQQQILAHGGPVIDAAKRWGSSAAGRARNLGGRFGQSGLERRRDNLAEAISALSSDSTSLAESLRPVSESLNEVGHMLKVSASLPFAKRKKAHMRIDDVLDELEAGLFDAILNSRPPDPEP